jgi:serine/threonine-protein phosphatase 2B catalytic subunit
VLKQNQALSIIRAHQVQIDGYKMHRWGGNQAFPSVITVFSAPNYCGSYNNKGAVIVIENERMNIKQYKDVDHPFHLPQDIDLFSWSMPFLAEKITDMLFNIISKNDDFSPKTAKEVDNFHFTESTEQADSSNNEDSKATNILKNKVRSIARL